MSDGLFYTVHLELKPSEQMCLLPDVRACHFPLCALRAYPHLFLRVHDVCFSQFFHRQHNTTKMQKTEHQNTKETVRELITCLVRHHQNLEDVNQQRLKALQRTQLNLSPQPGRGAVSGLCLAIINVMGMFPRKLARTRAVTGLSQLKVFIIKSEEVSARITFDRL